MGELVHRILTEALGHWELFLHSCEKERFKKTLPVPVEEQHGRLFAEFGDMACAKAFARSTSEGV